MEKINNANKKSVSLVVAEKSFMILIISGFMMLIMITCTNKGQSEWRQLFNGKDLTGWKHVGPGSMSVEDGLIRGHGGMGLLYWEGEKFSNCVIKVVWRWPAGCTRW